MNLSHNLEGLNPISDHIFFKPKYILSLTLNGIACNYTTGEFHPENGVLEEITRPDKILPSSH